jgi:hypothetical protein
MKLIFVAIRAVVSEMKLVEESYNDLHIMCEIHEVCKRDINGTLIDVLKYFYAKLSLSFSAQ